MYINYSYYQNISSDHLNRVVMQDRFKQYFSDLYAAYQVPLEINEKEFVFCYEEMASCLFAVEENQLACARSDYLFFPSWSFVLDSHCAIPELYLKNKFNWRGSILDIRDCGSLCVYHAIQLIIQLHQRQAVCCTIENVFSFNTHFHHDLFPAINYVALLSFSSEKKSCFDLDILHCHVYNNAVNIFEIIDHLTRQYHISIHQRHIRIRRDAMVYPASSGFLYDTINQIFTLSKKIKTEHVFIVDFDLITHFFGLIVIKLGENHVDSISG